VALIFTDRENELDRLDFCYFCYFASSFLDITQNILLKIEMSQEVRSLRKRIFSLQMHLKVMGYGIDVGGTYTDVVAYGNGKFEHILTIKTQEFLKKTHLLEKYKSGVFAIAGWIRGGEVLKTPNIKGFDTGIFRGVRMENDANCFAIYCKQFFKKPNIFAVTLGTGIGSAIIAKGELYKGRGLASEIGHAFVGGNDTCVCGGKGHLETHFSSWTIKRRCGRELRRDEIVRLESFELLCREIAKVILILDPDAVVFGGRLAMDLEEQDFERIYSYLPPEFDPEIRIIKDPLAVAKGAAILAGD